MVKMVEKEWELHLLVMWVGMMVLGNDVERCRMSWGVRWHKTTWFSGLGVFVREMNSGRRVGWFLTLFDPALFN